MTVGVAEARKVTEGGQATLVVACSTVRPTRGRIMDFAGKKKTSIIADEELESVWANKAPANGARHRRINRGNAALAACRR